MIVISGQTPAQKNSKKMSYASGRAILYTAPAVKAWQESASWQLKGKKQYTGEVIVSYIFHVKDNRRRDIDNMICTVNDALVKAGIIEDDSWQILEIGGAVADYDKENPRAEIFIESKREEVA